MSWFRLDDKFHSHTKIIAAGNAAVGLYVRAGCYCSDHSTDGLITFPVAALLGKPREAQALCDAGLWVKTDDGYLIPDYLDFNPSRAQVEAQRAERSEAKAKAGKIGGIASGRSRNEAQAKQKRSTSEAAVLQGVEANVKQNEAPTRPDPTPPLNNQISRQTDSVDTRRSVGLEAIRLYAAEQQPSPSVRDAVKWRDGIARTVEVERWDAIVDYTRDHPDATPEHVAFHALGCMKYAPKEPTWYPDPYCGVCDGDGWMNHAPEGAPSMLGPCPCRHPEPYLATVHPIAGVG